MQKLKQKLKSQTGASITFALLLFLVCAVVGSAVLVAGTAAAGRMSKVAEMDQRYYAVNSAARLLIDQIDGTDNTMTIVEQTDGGSDPDYYYLDASGSLKPYDPSSINTVALLLAYQLTDASGSSPLDIDLDLKTTKTAESSTSKPPLDVKISGTADNEQMTLTITSQDSDTLQYALKLQFNLTKSEVRDLGTISKNGVLLERKTATCKYTWNLQETQVVGSQRWA
ncbi:MAG: hypothetical protein J5916_11100 [Oscillospiraceae bacterium]|nr:hypothetical protein [Clostridia bacterium]MBO5640444.1 hypothetical protein [Oscillospiraceae bacterium]